MLRACSVRFQCVSLLLSKTRPLRSVCQPSQSFSNGNCNNDGQPPATPNVPPSEPVKKNAKAPILTSQKADLKVIVIDEKDLQEKFVRGSGNGGQKVNKTSNCVDLLHIPTNFRIKCHETRSREQNRKIARKRLKEKLDDFYNGEQSKRALKEAELRKKKARKAKKTHKKYGVPQNLEGEMQGETNNGTENVKEGED